MAHHMAAWLILWLNFIMCALIHANSYQYQPPVYQYEPYVPDIRTKKTDPPTTTTAQIIPETTSTTSSTTTSTTGTIPAAPATAQPPTPTETVTELNYKVVTSAIPATAGPIDRGYFSGYIPLGGFDGQINGHGQSNGNAAAPDGQQRALPPPPPYQIDHQQTTASAHESATDGAEAHRADPTTYARSSSVVIEATTPVLVPAPPVPFGEHSGTTQSQTEYEHDGVPSLVGTTIASGHVDAPSPPAPHTSGTGTEPESGSETHETEPEGAKLPESVAQPGYVFPSMINYGSINGPPPPKFVLERRGNKLKPQKASVGYGFGYPPSPRTTAPVTTTAPPDTTTTTSTTTTTATTTPEATTTTLAPTITTAFGTTTVAATQSTDGDSTGGYGQVTPYSGSKKTTTDGHVEATPGAHDESTIVAVTPYNGGSTGIASAQFPTLPIAATTAAMPSVLTDAPIVPSTPCPSKLLSTAQPWTTTVAAITETIAPEASASPKPPCTKGQQPPSVVDDMPAHDTTANGKPLATSTCKDGFDKCIEWADDGECEANPFWMKPNCQRSCKTCGILLVDIEKPTAKTENCWNHHELCQFWKKVGECERNEAYMSRNCPLSCGFC